MSGMQNRELELDPETAPYMSRSVLISEIENTRAVIERQMHGNCFSIQQNMPGFRKRSSTMPIDMLKSTAISQMLVGKVHTGNCLPCRSITLGARITGIQLVAEDTEGTAFNLSFYNFPTGFDHSQQYLDLLFPIGTTFVIREPTFKTATYGPYPVVRVDSPTDIIFVEPGNKRFGHIRWPTGPQVSRALPVPSTADGWKARGNALFVDSQWLPAAFAYSQGIALDPNATVFYLNRSEAYLRLEFYSGALADVQYVLSTRAVSDAFRGKALVRGGKAEYGRGRFDEALEMFQTWRRSHPHDEEMSKWITRCQQRIAESRSGEYDWAKLFRSSLEDPCLDVADYQGSIEVRQICGRRGGRGVVATKDVKVGELLLVAKPFVRVLQKDFRPREMMHSSRAVRWTSNRIVQKLYGNPDLHDLVFHLYAGSDHSSPPPSYPPVPPYDSAPVDLLNPTADIDIALLEDGCSHNTFTVVPLEPFDSAMSPFSSTGTDPTGLYLMPSLFNHACAENAVRHCIGDVMIIRAVQDIAAGQEIKVPYVSAASYRSRAIQLRRQFQHECSCWLCKEEQKDMEYAGIRRELLLQEMPLGLLQYMPPAQLHFLEVQLSATYAPSSGPVRQLLSAVQTTKGDGWSKLMHADQDYAGDAVKEYRRALQSIGFILRDEALTGSSKSPIMTDRVPGITPLEIPLFIIFKMIGALLVLKRDVLAAKWMKAAAWIVTTMVGGGKGLFLAIVGGTLQQLGLIELAKRVL